MALAAESRFKRRTISNAPTFTVSSRCGVQSSKYFSSAFFNELSNPSSSTAKRSIKYGMAKTWNPLSHQKIRGSGFSRARYRKMPVRAGAPLQPKRFWKPFRALLTSSLSNFFSFISDSSTPLPARLIRRGLPLNAIPGSIGSTAVRDLGKDDDGLMAITMFPSVGKCATR